MRGVWRGILVHSEMVKQLPKLPIHVEWCCICCPQCQKLSAIIGGWGQTSLQKPPRFAAPPPIVDVLWNVQHSPRHREGIYLQREWVHSKQPLPWSCSSHRNSPHIIFPSGLMRFTLSALDGNTEMQSIAPWSFLGCHNLKHQNTKQLNKPGSSTAFHQETEELSMGNTEGKAQLTPTLPLWRAEKVMACFPLLTGKTVSTPESFTLSIQPQAFCDTAAASATGKVPESGCPDRAAALSSLNTSWISEITYRSAVVKERLLEAEGPAEPAHPYQSLCD